MGNTDFMWLRLFAVSAFLRNRSLMAIAMWLLVGLVAPGKSLAGNGAPATQPTISDADFDDALDAIRSLSGNAMQQALISISSRFQTVDVCTSAGGNMWSFRMLNQRGKKFDAIRFTVPNGAATHLYWAFSAPNVTSWYIMPLSGARKSLFQDFYSVGPAHYDVPGVVNKYLILQEASERLEPGCEYALWFKLNTTKPVMFAGSLVLLDDDTPGSVSVIARAVGLHEMGANQ